jgi:D-glycero-D-manno-heptose 1,7-bisphosphate phosphatase
MSQARAGRRPRAVILDRDGTLVDFVRDVELGAVTPAFHPSQLRLLPGVIEGLHALDRAGFLLALATNQPGAAKGQITLEAIEQTNLALVELLAREGVTLAAVEVCLHHPEGGPGGDPKLIGPCACRKPSPGMLEAIVARLGLDLGQSWVLGDTQVDLDAARAAHLRCALVLPVARCELCPLAGTGATVPRPDLVADRFDRAVDAMLAAATGPAALDLPPCPR